MKNSYVKSNSKNWKVFQVSKIEKTQQKEVKGGGIGLEDVIDG